MVIVTTPSIEGYKISQYKGSVFASTVFGVDVFSEFFASWSDTFGGKSSMYKSELDNMYQALTDELTYKTNRMDSNAIVGLHLDFSEISGKGKSMIMATAIGTAVVIEKEEEVKTDRLKFAKQLHELYLYHSEGILSDEEFEYEVNRIKSLTEYDNPILDDVNKEKQLQKEREESARKRAEWQAHQDALKKEAMAKYTAEQLAREQENEKILAFINSEFANHRADVDRLAIYEIETASYEGLLPFDDMKVYDAIRFLISKGAAAAAGKYYVDKYHLSAADAKEYMLGIYSAMSK